LVFPFNYTLSGATVSLMYKPPSTVDCGSYGAQTPPQPKNDTMSVQCSGKSLVVTTTKGTTTYTK